MASREETLLFLVDVQVKNSQALRQLGAEFDSLQGKMDRHLASLQEANRGLIEQQRGADPIGAGPAVGSTGAPGSTSVVGIRGQHQPGSRMNPLVVTQESSVASGLGSLGQNNPGANGGNSGPSASDIANAIQAQNPNAGGIDPQVVDQTIRDVTTKVVAPENDRVIQAIQSQTAAQHRVAQAITSGGSGSSGAQDAANRQAMAQALADALEGRRAQVAAQPRTMTTGDAAQVLGRSRSEVREMAATGAIPNASKQNGQWVLSEDDVQKLLEDVENSKGGGGGAGGGGRPPVAVGGGSGGGGGGSRFQWSPFGGSRSNPDSGIAGALSFGNLFKGDGGRGGAFGLPGFGSAGSLGGLGLEHWILSALGVGVSAGSAVGGGALLGSASIAKSIVGGGADALVNKTTITDAKNYQTQLSALNEAIAVYGSGSKQAAAAQYSLNQTIKDMGGPADVTAIKALDEQVQDLRVSFDQASAAARVSSAEIDIQVVGLAQTYVPAVAQAAQRNLALINTGIKPLFTWLEGPQGMGIFKSLENSFAQGLPTTIHAASMAIEDFLRLMQAALPYTGGLSKALDSFFTAKNKEDASAYDAEVQKLVGDLREWEGLLKLLGEDMSLVFKQDAGTANAIVGSLTQMLQKLHDWETSSTGQSDLKTIFAVHKQQILELLTVFGHLAGDYGHFYTAVAPAMVTAVTDIAKVFNALAGALEKIPGGGEFAGLLIVMTKLGALGPALKLTAAALFGIDVAGKGAGGGAGGITRLLGGGGAAKAGVTGAEDAAGAAEGAGGVASAGLIKSILAKVGGTSAGKAVSSTVEAGTLATAGVAEGAGLEGLAASLTTVGGALAPLAAGLLPILAAAGGVAGLVELFKLFSSNSSPGGQVAKNVAQSLGLSPSVTKNVGNSVNAAQRAAKPAPGTRAGVTPQQQQQNASESAADFKKAGQQAGAAFVVGMGQVKFPSTLQVFEQMRNELNALPTQARGTASQTMLEFAQELQQQGKLPKGAVNNLVQLIEAQFPPLRAYLKKEGLGASQDISNALSLTEAVSNTKSAVQNLKQEFGNIFDNATTSSGNMLQQVTRDFSTLKGNMGSLTKAGQQQASQNLTQLKQTALSDATAMEEQVSNKMGILANNIASGSQSALTSATGDFSALASNVATAIGSGALAAGKGGQLLDEAMNNQLKALGAKPIPMVALKSLSVSQLLGEQHFITHGGPSNAGHGATAATGALLQIGARGQAGGDNVPLRVGNTNVVVGAGEQVAVINRHQQPIIDRALAKEGYAGLPGLFGSVRTPNYMAGGGFVPGFAQGGMPAGDSYVTASTYTGGQTADGQNADTTAGFAELSSNTPSASGAGDNFSALGNLPMHTNIKVTYPANSSGKTVTLPKIDVGGGGAAVPPATLRAIDLTGPAASELGFPFPGLANVWVNVAGHGTGSGGGAGSGASWQDLTAPTVSGTGAIADIVNAALGKDTKAANAYGAKQAAMLAPQTTVAGGGGMTFPFTYKGKLPAPVQRALEIANAIVAAHPPYVLAGYSPTGTGADGYDCSGMVSSILHAAGLDPAGYGNTFALSDWGEPGRGKYITVGIVDNGADLGQWPNNIQHTMMEIAGQYFESSGFGDGPHKDSGFVYPFPIWRHPAGLASGGTVGHKGQYGRGPVPSPADAAAGKPVSAAEQAFIKKNKGKPKHGKAPKHKGPKLTAPGKPKAETPSTSGPGIIGGDGPFPFNDATDLSHIDQMLNAIYSIAGGADGIPGTGNIMGLENDISYYTNAWGAGIASPPYPNAAGSFFGSFSSPSDFVTSTTDSAGNTTYAIDPNINTVAGQLAQMIGWQGGIVGDLTGANAQSGAVQGPINTAINRRVKEIAKIQKRVKSNAAQISKYQEAIKKGKAKAKKLLADAAAVRVKIAAHQAKVKSLNTQLTAEKKKKKPNKGTIASLTGQINTEEGILGQLAQQLLGDVGQADGITKNTIPALQADIVPLEAENVLLGGSKDKLGTGGEYGTIFGQLGSPAAGVSGIGLGEGGGQGATGLYSLLSNIQGWQSAIGGTNGDLAQQNLTLTEWQGDYTNLIPGANSALAADNLANVAATTNSTSPITGTVAFQFNGQEVLASTLAGMAQGGMLPWAGSFMTGGVIPGPIGASALAEVHGGEVITNPYLPGGGSGDSGQLSSAMSQLTNALCDHKAAVMQNTTAMQSNTTAVSSTTGGGAGVRYSGGAYSQHTSSDSIVGVGIGS